MIRTILTSSLLILLFVGARQAAIAQAHEAGMKNITVSVGGSLIGSLFEVVTNAADVEGSNTPVIIGHVDYAFTDYFSLGAGVGYQGYKIEFGESAGDYIDNIRCLNFAVRPLVHVFNSEELDVYGGVRIGFTSWSANTTADIAGYDPLDAVDLGSFTFHPMAGVTYYFSEFLGANMEVGVGTYLAAIGIKARIR